MKRTLILTLAIAISAAGLLLSTTPSGAQEPKFRHTDNAIPNQYIVVLDPETSQSLIDSTAQSLAATYGGTVGFVYEHALKGFSIQMSESAAISLSNDSAVDFVTEDNEVTLTGTQLNPPSWGLDRIDERTLPLDNIYTYKPTGRNVHAYVIDTGIRPTHQDFHGRASIAADFVGDGQNGNDCHGHGTLVAGTLGSTTYGVAKGVTIHAVRVIRCDGGGQVSALIAGVNWVRFNRLTPTVVNMSVAVPGGNDALDLAVTNSINSGITHVVGAGNDNANASGTSPARVGAAITVGATDITDTRAQFGGGQGSNFGSVLDLFAPGKDLASTARDNDSAVGFYGGTSAAAPHVAGVVAQYLQLNPSSSPATVRNAIVANATSGVVINPGTGSPNLLLFSNFLASPPRDTYTDFDADAKADLAIWRPSTGLWDILLSATNTSSQVSWGSQTIHNDQLVPGDYDGDDKADHAVWRPSTGVWYIIQSSTGLPRYEYFGSSGDIPVPADYDGDTITDVAVWRPSNGVWYIVQSSTATVRYETFGLSGDKPVAADYDADGKADVAVWRPSNGVWYILQSATATVRYETFGGASFNDVLVPADYDGDVAADVSVWRPGDGTWYILQSSTGTVRYHAFGLSGDIPTAADYDGDRIIDVSVWRPSNTTWYIFQSSNSTVIQSTFGASGDIPIPSAYNRY